MQIATVQFVSASGFHLPKELLDDLLESFSWGYHTRTLILPERMADAIAEIEDWAGEVARLRAFAKEHPGVCIDLES